MAFLIQLLRVFVVLFGVTPPKKNEEEKWALYLAGTLALTAVAIGIAVAVIFKVFGT